MPVYRIPFQWEMCDETEVQAESLEQAIQFVRDDTELHLEGHYVDGSFDVNEDFAAELAEIDKGTREDLRSEDPLEA